MNKKNKKRVVVPASPYGGYNITKPSSYPKGSKKGKLLLREIGSRDEIAAVSYEIGNKASMNAAYSKLYDWVNSYGQYPIKYPRPKFKTGQVIWEEH